MYRIFVLAIICMACNTNGNHRQSPAQAPLLPFFKQRVNPLLNNLEAATAKKILDSLLPHVKENDNYIDMCSWLRCMAVVYQLQNKLDSARQCVDRSLQLAQEKDTTQRQILASKVQTADIMADQHLLDSALIFGREAYFMAQKIDTPGLPLICLKLYNIYEKIGDLEMQKKYLFEGFKRSTSPKHKTVFAANIAAYYERVNQIDSAFIFFQALMLDTSFSNPYYNAVRYETLGTLLSKKGFLKEGLAHQLKGMQISRELGELTAESYFNIAATYRKLGQYNEDERLLDTALRLVAHEKDLALQKQIWQAKAENWTLQRKPWQANAAMDSVLKYYHKQVDSSVVGRARDLEAKYGLLEKDNQIKAMALARERQNSVIRRVISIAAIFVIFLYLAWRHKKNKMSTRENNLRQQLLRGQIDSHFLFNSVQNLQILIQKGNIENANEYVKQLAQLYWLCVENAQQPFVPLKNELNALASYLTLHKALSADQFNYHIEVEGVANQETILIPPMLLQPFVENAIVHGFVGQDEKGQINISIQKNKKILHCVIEDNGRGFQSGEDPSKKRPLSTIINSERLGILSRQTKTRAQLTIIDKKEINGEAGVRVELIVPYQTPLLRKRVRNLKFILKKIKKLLYITP